MPSSLSGRLLAGSAVFTLVALVFTLVLMRQVLGHFVTGQIDQRLDNKIVALASEVRADPNGSIRIDGDADGPPFDKPRHHSFWWLEGPRNAVHTAWLHDGDFTPPSAAEIAALPPSPPPAPPLPPDASDESPPPDKGRPQTIDSTALGGMAMHMRVARRTIGTLPVTIVVAAPMKAIAGPMREAMTTIGIAMVGLGLALLAATFAQVRLGLRPLGRLRADVAAVRGGRASAVPLAQPREIMPLVVELNSLLEQNAANLARARRHVANLAHGLKTPLATLSLNVDRLPDAERQSLRDLVDLVERRIRHHLGRARAAALDGPARSQTRLAGRLRDLTDALSKIYAAKAVTLVLDCAADIAVACEPQDVDEILGNLLDNAFKFTRARVDCAVRTATTHVVITIADDGPGLRPDDIARVLRAGQRLDEDVPGHGFGLTIARELAELYAGELALGARETGLLVTLSLPRAM